MWGFCSRVGPGILGRVRCDCAGIEGSGLVGADCWMLGRGGGRFGRRGGVLYGDGVELLQT